MQRSFRLVSLVVLLASLAVAARLAAAEGASGPPTVGTGGDYKVGPGDKLQVSIRAGVGTEAVDITVPVAGDGTLDVVYIGRIKVSGLTTPEIQSRIKGALVARDIFKAPHVAVNVSEYLSQGVNVSGLVNSPGRIWMKGAATLLDVLSAAGGVDEESAGPYVQVTRAGAAAPLVVKRRDLFSRDPEQARTANIAIQADDNIYVPPKQRFCIVGPVKKPGCYPAEEDMNVLQAISVAEGFDEGADRRALVIKRRVGGQVKEIRVDMDAISRGAMDPAAVEGDDQIVVSENLRIGFCVRGPVTKPDCYEVEKAVTVEEAVSLAGELDPLRADRKKIVVRRSAAGGQIDTTVNLDDPGPAGARFAIQDGDQVIVGEVQFKVTVDGAVREPGRIDLTPDMTIVDAIAAAGGTRGDTGTFAGALKRVKLLRKGKVTEVNVKAIQEGGAPNVLLEPGDVITVPQRLF